MSRSAGLVLESPPGRAVRGPVLFTIAGKAAEAVTLVLLVTVVPRTLGPSDYGAFGLALALVTIGSTASSLGGQSLVRIVAGAPADERPALVRALTRRALHWRGLWAGAIVCLSIALALVDPGRFGLVLSLLVALAIALDVGATLAFQLAVALDKTVWWSFRYPAQTLLLVGGALALYGRDGLEGAIAAIPIASGAALLVGAAVVAPSVRSAPRGGVVSAHESRFLRLQWGSGLLTLLTHRGGIVVVAVLAGSSEQTGYAALAIGAAVSLMYVGAQIFLVSLPRLSTLVVEASGSADAALRHLGWVTVGLLGPVGVLGAAVTGTGLASVVGSEFADARSAIVVGLAAAPLAALTGTTGSATVLRVRPEVRVWAAALGLVVFGAVSIALVPSVGAVGASAGLLAATAVTAAAGLAFFPDLWDTRLVAVCAGASVCTLLVGLLA